MKPIVIYSSKTGNTEKVAAAIAEERNCKSLKVAKDVTAFLYLDEYDFFFVGTGITYGNPNEDLMAFLSDTNFPSSGQCAIFITWGGAGRTNQVVLSRLRTALQLRGLVVSENSFFCYGGWNFLRRGHPKADELVAARAWAKKVST